MRLSLSSSLALLALTLAAPALLGACTGGDGDPPSKPAANEYGTCGRLAKTVGPATWLNPDDQMGTTCVFPPDRNVCLAGLTIIAIDRFDETSDGKSFGNYYVQDSGLDPAPYAGITIFRPSFSPPDLRLAEGDVVDFLGTVQEFGGPSTFKFPYCHSLPELSGALTFRFDGNVVATPKEIPLTDLESYETGRQHLGTLVKITGVKIDQNGGSASKGRFSAAFAVQNISDISNIPQITNELYDIQAAGPALDAGAEFASVTGVVTFFAGFHIAPRSPADFEKLK